MEPPFPSFTSIWHNDTYPAISPSRPELSAAGKTIVITGAGSGIGRAVALSFARAGARKIALIGRTETKLLETQKLLTCDSSVHAASVTNEANIEDIAAQVGTWDVLILNAAYLAAPETIVDSSVDDWWQSFETNVRGTMMNAKVFQPTARPSGAVVIGMTAGMMLPVSLLAGLSAYMSSKIAAAKVLEFFAAENPGITVVSLLPGIIDTEMLQKSNLAGGKLPLDTLDLPADCCVWLASPEASFLSGRQIWAHWDVDELKTKKEEIRMGTLLTAGIYGWPHPHGNKEIPL
ncbi:hypothetical protein BDV59DRAFT_196457 [Aspergillus ambiguus]|uniref:SDR family NAD(P)-dependent oxidoreductase n=1 Tax=Aspergillus ambiguus TaxID=176160 RepID=UPI003CCCD6AE